MPLPRIVRTASFRLSALYALVFGGCVLLLGAAAFWSTRSALERQLSRRIEAESTLLEQEFAHNGIDGLVATVRQRMRVRGNLDYFVLDPAGKRLAGDLPGNSDRVGWVELQSGPDAGGDKNSENETVRVLVRPLAGGYRLGVGEDIEQVGELEETLLGILASALGLVLVLGIGGGLLLSAAFLRRVDMITRTADAIIGGDLSRRIERTGSDDDFDHLSATLNTMLDRIAGLMENLRQVSNDIAHDLRTPLSRLRQDLEEAQKRDLDAADLKRVIESAVAEADVLLETFSALLRIAQIEAGTRRSAFRAVDLSDVLRTVAEAYAPAIEEGGRALRAEIADGVRLNGDRGLLSQLFANLVENALHHTPTGATITLRLARQPAFAVAEVADNGAGIPADERVKVLRRFYRLERSRTTPGSGLGLSTVAAIVELHRAAIELIDNEPGLRVVIRFPA
ncbi:MAG TPA: HAMP domain-containing sensor histidine kinase [Xanthobacteraceae bacterium]|nr:HAMP domain-containing sensor histidine kinase [Xanthobacteraceae bacterium]